MSKSMLDEYIKRRERENESAVYNPRQTPYGQGMSYRQPAAPQMQQPANQSGQVPVYRPNQWSRPAMVKAPTVESDLNATPQTNTGGSNVLTWDDQIDIEIQAAAKKVLDVSNRKFQYSPYESPIYSIMRQEYLKEADLAQGRATAAAAQNAGGFGSSFAVMAGEEARRQVMEGFHDQEDELYGAAQAEFEAERASAFDRYLQLRELKDYEKLKAEEEARAAGGLTETVQNAYNAAVQIWDGTNEAQVRSVLKNQGLTDAEIEATVGMLRGDTKAVIEDNVKMFEKNPTLSGAVSIMNEARLSGNENEFVDRVSSATANAFSTAINDYSKAGSVLGFEQSEWNQLDDESKGTRIISTAGEAFKNGILTEKDFSDILMESVEKDFSDPEIDITEVLANVNGVLLLRDNGTITEDISKRLLEGIAKIPAAQQASEKITKDLQNVFVKPIMSKAEKEAFRALYLAINGK